MITISGASNVSRYIPVQRDAYRIAFDGIANSTDGRMSILCSGSGSVPFSFGVDNGSFFTSGNSIKKLYPISSSTPFGQFAIDVYQSGYNVFLNGIPLAFGISKSTGAFEQLIFAGDGGDWVSQANVKIYGETNIIDATTNSVVLPRNSPMVTGIPAANNGAVPVRVLLTLPFGFNNASGISPSNLTVLPPFSSGEISFSGQYLFDSDASSMLLTYSTDGQNDQLVIPIYPTEYSGEGIRVTVPSFGAVDENVSYSFFVVENTGTVSKPISPYITAATVQIPNPFAYMHSGYRVVCSSGNTLTTLTGIATGVSNFRQLVPLSGNFYYSDTITTNANTLKPIQYISKDSVFYGISGVGGDTTAFAGYSGTMNHAGRSLGAFCAQQLGHSFLAPHTFAANYIDLPLRADGDHLYLNSGSSSIASKLNFRPEDRIYMRILSGDENGTVLATGSYAPSGFPASAGLPNKGMYMDTTRVYYDGGYDTSITNPSLYPTSFKSIRFSFPNNVVFESGLLYTIMLSGAGAWMSGEVSGQRHITWQSIYNQDIDAPHNRGTIPVSLQGTGFCEASHITGFPVRPFMYDGDMINVVSGYVQSGITQFLRFRPSGDYYADKIVIPLDCEHNTFNNPGLPSLTGLNFHVMGMTGTDYPDQASIFFDLIKPTDDLYVYDRDNYAEASYNLYFKEAAFTFPTGFIFNSGVDYWLCLSGQGYPVPVGSVGRGTLPLNNGEYDTDFTHGGLPIMISGSNLKFMTYDYRTDFWYTGSATRTYQKWFWFRLLESGCSKQYFEAKQVFCFGLGHQGNIWDCNFVGGSGSNEHRYGYDYSYNKFQSDKMFQILDALPVDCRAGFSKTFTVRYDGTLPETNWGTIHIPEFGYSGLFTGVTQ